MALLLTNLTSENGVKGLIYDPYLEEAIFTVIVTPNKLSKNELIKSLKEDKKVLFVKGEEKVRLKIDNLMINSTKSLNHIGHNVELVVCSSTKLDSRTSSLEEMFFLVKKGKEEEEIANVKELFFNNFLKNLPIPTLKEWEGFLWDTISPSLEILPTMGSLPFNGYKLSIKENDLIDLIPKIASKAEFKDRFGRVPKIEELLNIYDIKNFNFKDWQKTVEKIGGIEKFKKIEFLKEFVLSFELLGSELVEEYKKEEILSTLHASSLHYTNVMLRKEKDKNKKQEIKRLFKNLFLAFKDKDPYIFNKVISSFPEIYEEELGLLKNKSWKKVEDFALYKVFKGEYDTFKEFSLFAMKNGVSENSFQNKYMPLIEAYVTEGKYSYRDFPTIKKNNWEILDWTEPQSWFVGIETNCCQHLDSAGRACVEYGVKHIPTSGIFRVMDKKGDTIAQSFLWLSNVDINGKRVLVCDNIEYLGDGMRDSMVTAYKEMAEELAKYANLFGIKAITIGAGFGGDSIESLGIKNKKVKEGDTNYGVIPRTLGYTDARKQYLLKEFDKKENK